MKTIAQKIVAVRREVGGIEKSSQGYGYTYQGADEVFTAVRTAMNNHNLLMVPSMESITSANDSWVIHYVMRWIDGDSGESLEARWLMTIPVADAKNRIDDKAMGKASTYAVRYYLLRTLLITTRDDISNDIDAGNPDNLPVPSSSSSGDAQMLTVVVDSVTIEPDANNKLWLVARPSGVPLIAIPTRTFFAEAGWDTSNWTEPGSTIHLNPPAEIMFNRVGDRCEFIAVDQWDEQ